MIGAMNRESCSWVLGFDLFKIATAVSPLLLAGPGNLVGAPVNDNFTNRIQLTGDFISTAGDNTHATEEPNEPTEGIRSIWWAWIAPTSGTYTVTATAGNFAPCLFVFTGSELPSLTLAGSARPDELTRRAQVVVEASAGISYSAAITTCQGVEGPVSVTIIGGNPPAVSIVTPTNGGMVYATDNSTIKAEATDMDGSIVKVEFFANWQGALHHLGTITNTPFEVTYNFSYSFGDGGPQSARVYAQATDNTGITAISPVVQFGVTYPPPVNDAFTNRLAIAGSFFAVAANNLYATHESGDPTPGRGSLWWTWTAPSSGLYSLSAIALAAGSFVPYVGVFSGSTLTGLVPVGTNAGTLSDTSYSARVTLDAVAGTSYTIGVSAVAIRAGELRLCISPPNPPSTAEFEAITPGPSPPGFPDNAVSLLLRFRTGSGSRWRIESSTNLATWQPASQQFLPNCRLDFTISNAGMRLVGQHDYEWYVLPHLFFRLGSAPPDPLGPDEIAE
jgi:hypothetical protein